MDYNKSNTTTTGSLGNVNDSRVGIFASAGNGLNISGNCKIESIPKETELEKLYANLLSDARLSYEILERLQKLNNKLSPREESCCGGDKRCEPYSLLEKLFATRYTNYQNMLDCLNALTNLEEII